MHQGRVKNFSLDILGAECLQDLLPVAKLTNGGLDDHVFNRTGFSHRNTNRQVVESVQWKGDLYDLSGKLA